MPDVVGTINYPDAVDTHTTLIETANNAVTVLNGSLNDSSDTIQVVSTDPFPDSGVISIDDEIISYAAKNSTTFTGCVRGFDDTVAASHDNEADVQGRLVSAHIQTLQDAIIAMQETATTDDRGMMSAADKAKVDGIEANATANDSDANLKNRANHTGTQALSTIEGVTATTSEINVLDGITASTAELNYTDGVTSNIQSQLNGKAASSHTHSISNVTGLQTALDAKASTSLNNLSNAATARGNLGLGTAAVLDVASSGDASTSQIVKGNDTRLVHSGACVFNSGVAPKQSIPSTAPTNVTWNSEKWDTDGYHSTSSNTHYLTVPAVGYYRVSACLELRNLTIDSSKSCFTELTTGGNPDGGVGVYYWKDTNSFSQNRDIFEISAILHFSTTSPVWLNTYQNTGSAVDLYTHWFSIEKIG